MTESILLDQETPITAPAAVPDDFQLVLGRGGKYVVEVHGAGIVDVGVYGPFGVSEPLEPGRNGRLRVCGAEVRGCRVLGPGEYLVRATRMTSDAASLLVRHWRLTDYFTIFSYRSTC